MPLDEFRTQVLLLHSEQSTLDKLSSGFSETYTVHCATSGSEALNTLGETQIDVIVSAQELPGMSGLEALREAKKRSPDTIGILLASTTDDGLEALVGDKEVFQIVRGTVSGEAILELVHEATQQMRLMTLAKSANDTAANVDKAAPEHIVMETAENGSALVSDGSARLPALDSGRFSSIAAAGSPDVDLLILTKDQEFLATIKASSRGMHTVHYANTLAQAVDALNSHGIGVAVVDAAMVGDKVEQLAQHLRKISQRLVCIVAGRRDDGEMLMDLINRGKVYRFLLKPVSPGRARLAVEASVKHHLEAPDAAFNTHSEAAARLPDKTPSMTAVDGETQPTAPPHAQSVPDVDRRTAPQSSDSTQQAEDTSSTATSSSTVDDKLEDAFDDSEQGFTATVSGLLSSVGKKSPLDTATTTRSLKATSSELESTPAAGSGGSLWQSPKMLGVISVAVIAIAGATFWLSSGPDKSGARTMPVAAPPAVTEAEVFVDTPATETTVVVNPVIDEARAARDAGQIVTPDGSNALELYLAAVTAEPDNRTVIAELDAVIVDALAMAETAMLESRIDDAETALQRIAAADPDNARLPFLTAQLSQIQMRGYLTDARSAILESRFEDASSALEFARLLNIADTTELDTVASELDTARGAQESEEVLATAHARLDDDALLSPVNDNARYYFELVLENDPENAAAQQGLTLVASKLALQARVDIDNGYLDSAQELLGAANSLDPSNNEALAAAAALSSKRDAVAAAQRRAKEEQQAAERAALQAAEQRAAKAAAQPAPEQADEGAQALVENAANTDGAQASVTSEENNEAANAADGDDNVESATAADTTDEPTAEKPAPAKPEVADSRNTPTDAPLTAVSTLSRTKYVAPRYPRAAQRRNISGWVDVAFTVSADGTVKDVEVRNSEPGDTFVNAAINAVEKWEFEPVLIDGVGVEKRAGIRMMFALE